MVIKFTLFLNYPFYKQNFEYNPKTQTLAYCRFIEEPIPSNFYPIFRYSFHRKKNPQNANSNSFSLSNPYTQSNSNTNLLKYTSLLKSQAETPYTLCIKAIHSSIAADFPLSDPEPVPRLLQYYLYRRPRLTSICACKHQ